MRCFHPVVFFVLLSLGSTGCVYSTEDNFVPSVADKEQPTSQSSSKDDFVPSVADKTETEGGGDRQEAQGEVFVGPLAGWKNAKSDYGAVGDGLADDTPAIQKALDDLRTMKFHVLYFPAGTYRVTKTLELPQVNSKPNGVKIVGEDPKTTAIVWDGGAGGSMFLYNPWYSSLGRLTFDGRGKAGKIIEHGPVFLVWNEYFDLVFKNADVCLDAGKLAPGWAGIADSAIIRSKFINCAKAGVHISNFNSLQWGIYDSLFQNNGLGVTNGGMLDLKGQGNFHIYRSVFLNSTWADVSIGNTGFFTVRDSVSVGSNAFYIATVIGAPAQVTLQRNIIIDSHAKNAPYFINKNGDVVPHSGCANALICNGNTGTLILLDNVVRAEKGFEGAIVKDTGPPGGFLSVGNRYTAQKWFQGSAASRFRSIDDDIVAPASISDPTVELANTPPKVDAPIIEIPPGSGAVALQQAVDQAAGLKGQKPVVHLPAGFYPVNKTIVVPPDADLQIVGDGWLNTTSLAWTASGEGPVLHLQGPSKASVRDLTVLGQYKDSAAADGLAVTADGPDSKIRLHQAVSKSANAVGFFVGDLQKTAVEMSSSGIGGAVGLQVRGTGASSPQVTVMGEGGLGGDVTYDIRDANVVIRDSWTESRAWLTPKYARIRGQSKVTFHNTNNDHPRSLLPEKISTLVEDLAGRAAFIGTSSSASSPKDPRKPENVAVPADVIGDEDPQFKDVPAIQIQGVHPGAKAALIGSIGWGGNYFKNVSTAAQVGRVFSSLLEKDASQKVITKPLDDIPVDDDFVRELLEQTRATGSLEDTPVGGSDVRLHRVLVDRAKRGFVMTPALAN